MAYDVTPAEYVGSGPAYPGETDDQALGENAAYYLGGHLLTRHVPAPGHGFEHEPTDKDEDEKESQDAAQAAGQAPVLDYVAMARSIRQALRPGN